MGVFNLTLCLTGTFWSTLTHLPLITSSGLTAAPGIQDVDYKVDQHEILHLIYPDFFLSPIALRGHLFGRNMTPMSSTFVISMKNCPRFSSILGNFHFLAKSEGTPGLKGSGGSFCRGFWFFCIWKSTRIR